MKTLRMLCALAFVAGCGGGSTTDAGPDASGSDAGTHDAGADASSDAGSDAGTQDAETDLGSVDLGPDVSACHPEVCNGIDDDCDGTVDNGVSHTYYPDADHDLHGDGTAAPMLACSLPAGYAENDDDCNDANAAMHPGAVEACNGIDDDCDGIADPPSLCACTTGTARPCGLPGACAAGVQMCIGGTYGACSISPTPETCNGVDDDCNGVIDDGLLVTCYPDVDGDTYSSGGFTSIFCPDPTRPSVGGCPGSYTNVAPRGTTVDCDDTRATVSPAGVEVCDGLDDNCNGTIDEGLICP